jgi:hypothetical protein
VRVVELLALDDRGEEPLLEQHPDERDVDQRDGDDAEVVRAEQRGEQERDEGGDPARPARHHHRPLERGAEAAARCH